MDLTDHFSYISYVEILTRLKAISEKTLLERLSFPFDRTQMAGLKSATTLPFDMAMSSM